MVGVFGCVDGTALGSAQSEYLDRICRNNPSFEPYHRRTAVRHVAEEYTGLRCRSVDTD